MEKRKKTASSSPGPKLSGTDAPIIKHRKDEKNGKNSFICKLDMETQASGTL